MELKNTVIVHQNIDGLKNKIERLTHFLQGQNPSPHIVILTEHGLKSENLENIRIPEYKLIGSFCRTQHRKGGVAVFASLQFQNEISILSISNEESEMVCESVLLKIKYKKYNLFIMGVYRPPQSNLDNSIDVISTELYKIPNPNEPIVVMGDINVDYLTNSGENQCLTDALGAYNLRRIELPPTRVTHHSKSSIDFICTNMNEEKISHCVITTGLSDHTAQLCSITAPVKNTTYHQSKKRIINDRTMEDARHILATQNWININATANTNSAFSAFDNVMKFVMDTACPYKKIKIKPTRIKRVWDAESMELRRFYLEALNREILTGDANDKRDTALAKKNYDLKLKDLRRKQHVDYIEQADNKSKALWKVINSERKLKNAASSIESLHINGEMCTKPENISNHLNNFFSTIAQRTLQQNAVQNQGTIVLTNQNPPTTNLHFYDTNEQEIKKIIDSMKAKTSAGEDEISSKMIKHCKDEITTPLVTLINKSFNEGTFPDSLKTAKVYPKFKSGKTTEAANYRPISLISNFSKILERVVLNRLLEHLQHHNLLTPRQHGFIKNRSTATAIVQLVESIIDQLEQGYKTTTILLDFSKAFDCLDHKLIVKKLNTLGVTGKEAQWFKSYLSDRKQLVEITYKDNNTINTVKSSALHMSRGVPQGSVLGPVLYILLANDFPKYLEEFCETVMYADDTALIIANKNKEELDIATDIALNMAKQYCNQNDLVLNENKSYQLIFTTTPNQYEGLPELTTVESHKYLGIILDNKLSWEPHLNLLCKKLSSSIFVIRRIKQISNSKTALTAYYSLFESHLRYGLVVWGGTSATLLQKILIIQKRAVRTLKGLSPRDTCRNAFKELRILTVVSLYILETILFTVKSGKTRTGDQHHYNTRHRHNFMLDTHHLSLFGKKPSYCGATYYNCLPHELKILPEKNLKRTLTDWLMERSFYSIREFLNWSAQT